MNRPTEQCAPADECPVDCIADSAGGITFDLPGTVPGDAVLVLRRRGLQGAYDDVRLPLTRADGRRSRAVLPSTVALAEGHWDVLTGEAGERSVRTGLRDVRALVGRVPEAGAVTARVPYPTADRGLALRSWVRAPHAEAGEVHRLPGAVTVEGVLYGARTGDDAVVEARLRGGERLHRVPVTGRGGVFAFTLPYAPLAAGYGGKRQWWDLWLLPGGGMAGARVARILDDVWDKRRWSFGAAHEADGLRALPRYTEDNGLSVRLDPARVSTAATRM
jgi:hypothetical protein